MWPHPPSHLLLDHADSLRSMARALLRDEHAADDVVQDTWVRALAAAPSTDRGLGGWLQRVAEGFALRHRRTEARHVERERRYAAERPEAFDTEQRGVVLRAVFEAVLALDEPYRETVLLRWFEGLPPRAIAERLGVRVATIDSRLQRAHARLRATLERDLRDERGGWRACVAVCLGAPRATPGATTFALPLIGVVVGLKTFAGAAAAVIALCLWLGWDRADPQIAAPPELAAAAPIERGADPLAVAEPTTGRALASEPESDSNAKGERAAAIPYALERGPHRFDVRVEVVDASERPVPNAQVDLGPLSGSVARFGETTWEGVLARGWFGFEPRMECVIAVRQSGSETSARRVVLTSGANNDFRFQLDPTGSIREFKLSLSNASSDTVVVGGTLILSEPDDAFVVDAAGNGMFVDRDLARVIEANTVEARAAMEAISLETEVRFSEVARFSSEKTAVDRDVARLVGARSKVAPDTTPATVRGVVHDEYGRPLVKALVTARTPNDWRKSAVTNAAGEFAFENVPPGKFVVDAGGGERHVVRERLELADGDARFVDLRPTRRSMLRVALSNSAEKPLANWRVEARSTLNAGLVLGAATTDETGAAVIGLSSDEAFAIYARPVSRADSPAAFVGRHPSAPRDVLNLRLLDDARPGSILVTVDAPKGLEVEARAWRLDGDEGMTLHDSAVRRVGVDDDRRPNPRLLPGRWRVELRAPGRPWTSIGEFALAPGEELDLGLTALPPCATLRMQSDGAADPIRVVALRAVVDGALVQWSERTLTLPVEIETYADTDLDVLVRANRDGAPTTRTHAESQRFPVGAPHVIDVR